MLNQYNFQILICSYKLSIHKIYSICDIVWGDLNYLAYVGAKITWYDKCTFNSNASFGACFWRLVRQCVLVKFISVCTYY